MQDAYPGVGYSMGTKATRRKAAVHYCCSSKHNNNKALRITFNCCKTVSTSSMALATVNIDKIIKVTSASSYVYEKFTYFLPYLLIYE